MAGILAASLPTPPSVPASQRVAKRAEELGYESLWIADSGGPDPFVVAAAAAAVTTKVRIGTAVIPAYTRTPPVISCAAASCAELAPGRFILGIGASSENIVQKWSGIPFKRPLSRVRETVAAVRGILAGEKSDLSGRTLETHGYRLQMIPPNPAIPIHVGALGPPMLELAGEIADGVTLNMMPVGAVPKMLAHVKIGAEKSGRNVSDLEIVSRFMVCVTDDPQSARGFMRGFFGPYFATSVYNRFVAWCGFEEEAKGILEGWKAKDRAKVGASVTDAMIDSIAVIGSADECRDKLEAFRDAGVTTPMISPITGDEAGATAMLEALAPGN